MNTLITLTIKTEDYLDAIHEFDITIDVTQLIADGMKTIAVDNDGDIYAYESTDLGIEEGKDLRLTNVWLIESGDDGICRVMSLNKIVSNWKELKVNI